MENQKKSSSFITAIIFVVIGLFAWNAVSGKNNPSELGHIAEALEDASQQNNKAAASLLFDRLSELKYKYSDEKNIPCLQAVMSLTSGADEVNATGTWTNKQQTLSEINQCKG